MVQVHEGTYMLLRCSLFVVQESHAARFLMVYVHEVLYMLLRVDAFAATLLKVQVHEVTFALCASRGT